MDIAGTYPMLYAFFDASGALVREAVTRQVNAALAVGASGIACLGLGTEVAKLSLAERRQIIDWVIADVRGRAPVAVTIADGNVPDMIESARYAERAGASWLILQPPRPPASGADLIRFFASIAQSVSLPCGIQNAPEFLGIGLTSAELLSLHAEAPNVTLVKAEASAVAVARTIEAVKGRMRVFNGRAGLELTDNYRAGVDGMIPGMETIDLQVAIEKAMRAGEDEVAEGLYRRLLPTVTFIMQGLPQLLTYGKLIAALRLGITPSAARLPAEPLSALGEQWALRLARELGPLPG
jgi:4-hydroxy-tetrahydrodipicolinate synthase